MPDYNLGRAHGEIVITADTRGADQAQRAMEDATHGTEDLTKATQELSRVEQERNKRQAEATQAQQRRKDAEREYQRVVRDTKSTVEQTARAEAERNKAIGEHLQASKRLSEANRALNAELLGNTDVVNKFTRSLDRSSHSMDTAHRRMRDFNREAKDLSNTLSRMNRPLTSFLTTLSKVAAFGAGGLAIGGGAGLLGAGGIQGVTAATAAVAQLSGALLLLPAAVGGAVTVMGTLVIATQGVGEAFKNMDDPAKFAESLRKLSPAAAQVVYTLATFKSAFEGAQRVIQEGLFAPLVNDIRPLVLNLLPLLMNGLREVASVIGQAGHQFAQWLMMPDTMSAIGTFIHNIAEGLRSMLPAMQPILDAFKTLSVVGSSFFGQIGEAIVRVANAFNNWVQGAAASGQLQEWIQSAINAFGQIFDIVKNLGVALGNIFQISGQYGGFLDFIQKIAAQFRAWTESVEGQKTLQEFFATLNSAATALGPVLRPIADGIGTIITTLLQLGTATAPGLTSFFQSFAEALKILGPSLVAAAPAVNEFLTAFGQVIVGIVQGIGPALPNIMRGFAEVAKDLAPTLVSLAKSVGDFLSKLTPGELETLIGIAASVAVLAKGLGLLATAMDLVKTAMAAWNVVSLLASGPIGWIIIGVAALIAIIVLLVTHWDEVKAAAQEAWNKLKEFGSWIKNVFVNAWKDLAKAVSDGWNAVTETIHRWWDNTTRFFSELPGKAWDWGKKLITGLGDGIRDAAEHGLKAVIDWVASLFPDSWFQHSPAKRGPLSKATTFEMGQRLGDQYAAGVAASQPGVADAASAVAGGAASGFTTAGEGGGGGGAAFTSAGVSGRSGKAGKSGFEQWVAGIAAELGAWKQLAQDGFNTIMDIFDIVVDTTRIVANLWNGGNNPLTQPGGLFGPPAGVPQEQVPGVPAAPPPPGQAPDEYGRVLGGQTTDQGPVPVPQEQVPGVPSAPPPPGQQPAAPAPPPPAPAATDNPAAAPPPNPVPAAPAAPTNPVPGDTPLIAALRAKGLSPKQIRLIIGFSKVEGNNPAGNPTLGFTDAQVGGPELNKHVDALIKQFQDRQGVTTTRGTKIGPFPENGTDREQAQWIADVVGQAGVSSDIFGQAQPKDYVDRVIAALPGGVPPAAEAAPAGPSFVGNAGQGAPVKPPPPGSTFVGNAGQGAPVRPPPPGGSLFPETGPLSIPPGTPQPPGIGAPPLPTNQSLNLSTIPVAVQKYANDCIDASARIILSHSGVNMTEDELMGVIEPGTNIDVQAAGLNKLLPQGKFQAMQGSGGSQQVMFNAIKASIDKGVGSILNVAPGSSLAGHTFAPGHFIAVTGYNPDGTINVSDTANGKVYTVTAEDAYQATRGRGIVAGTGTGPLPTPGGPQVALKSNEVPLAPPQAPPPPPRPGPTVAAVDPNQYPAGTVALSENGTPIIGFPPGGFPPGFKGTILVDSNTGLPLPGPGQAGPAPGSQREHRGAPPIAPPPPGAPAAPGAPPQYAPTINLPPSDSDWMRLPEGWDPAKPIPKEVRQAHGIPDSMPDIFYSVPPGPVANVPAVPGSAAPTLAAPPQAGTPPYTYEPPGGRPPGVGAAAGAGLAPPPTEQAPTQQQSPIDQVQSIASGISSIAGEAFQVFDDIITNIVAAADMTSQLVRGFENTEDINRFIDNFQTFIKTAADVAQLTSTVLSFAGGLAGMGGPMGGQQAAAGLQAASAIAAVVSAALTTTNAVIDLTQDAYKMVTKYGAIFAGYMLGGPEAGALAGNVRMLLNTRTGELYAYSQENPDLKETKNLPSWMARSYGGVRPGEAPQTQVNIYTGPGANPKNLISDTMWLVNSGAATSSIAGAD